MNSEALEISKNECYVIGDDAKVRRLTKTNPNSEFKDIFETENEIEVVEKEIDVVSKAYNEIKGHYLLTWGITIAMIVLCKIGFSVIGYFAHDITLSVTLTKLNDIYVFGSLFGIITAGVCTIGTALKNLFTKIQLKKQLSHLNEKLGELNIQLKSYKFNSDVKEEVLSNNIISSEVVNVINAGLEKDLVAKKADIENNYRVLRQFQREYQGDIEEDEEEKGFTYSLRR